MYNPRYNQFLRRLSLFCVLYFQRNFFVLKNNFPIRPYQGPYVIFCAIFMLLSRHIWVVDCFFFCFYFSIISYTSFRHNMCASMCVSSCFILNVVRLSKIVFYLPLICLIFFRFKSILLHLLWISKYLLILFRIQKILRFVSKKAKVKCIMIVCIW